MWNKKFNFSNGSSSLSDIQGCFEYASKNVKN